MNAMDAAEIVVSALIEKLQTESTSIIIPKYPMLEMQVQAAINKLHLLKRRLKLAEELEASPGHSTSFDDQRTLKLLQAIYSADDAADTLLTRVAFQIKAEINGSKKRCQWPSITSFCRRTTSTHYSKTFKDEFREYLSSYDHLVQMTSDIEELVDYSNDTRSSSQNDHKGRSRHVQQRWGRISDFYLKEETDVVGLKEQITELVNDLPFMADDDHRSSRVIAVVGEGGSGKTSLVGTVYNTLLQTRKFNESAWVHVPRMFRSARHVFANILKQIDRSNFAVDAEVSEEKLISELTAKLNGVKYFIVIEDVESSQDWAAIRQGVIFRSHGTADSRIIVTTRSEDVASEAIKADSIVKVCQLNNEGSWDLFLQNVRLVDDVWMKSYSALITLKEQILKVSGGLPLRIVLLGGLLSTKEPSNNEWSRVIERANNIGGDIFALCYHDLPSQLKPCFLYMGLFPRGFEIPVRRLIHLWLCEGLVKAPLDPVAETDSPEDLAEMYFEELVIRNMIQVRWRLDGSPKTCFMPCILHDFFSPKAAHVGFFYHLLQSSDDSTDQKPQFAVRRLAKCLGIKNNKSCSSFLNIDNLRSYVAFGTQRSGKPAREIGTFLNKIIAKEGFGLLKVLDLEGVYKPVLSEDAIGRLLLLSYLGLRSTAIDILPSPVGNLPCLETLDVQHTMIYDLPTSTWEAKKLRHLYLNWSCSCTFRSSSLSSEPPTNLHTLWGLSIDDDGVGFLKKLTGLRKLGLTCTSESTAEATAQWVSQLTKLHSLKLRSMLKESNGIFDLDLPTMANHSKLQNLYLVGGLSKRSLIDIEFPPNVRILTLSRSGLKDDPMPVLGRLPHLHILRLFPNSYRMNRMTCESKGFAKLLVLKLWGLPIEEWTVEEGAMPRLREMEIRWCTDLRHSTGLKHLTTLKEVALINTPLTAQEFVESEERNLYICKRG